MNNQSRSQTLLRDGIVVVRAMVGLMLILLGLQLFNSVDINLLADRLANISVPYPDAFAYAGKIVELAGGFLLMLGLFTRLATTFLFLTFLIITFVPEEGKIVGFNQLPFLYSLISLIFFFVGPGRLSVDYILAMNKREQDRDDPAVISKKFGRYVSKS